jgi:short-subunit dehydrogenase
MQDFQGKWALITGASSGIGADFARQLAPLGMHLILTARREDRLQKLAEQIRSDHGVEVVVLVADLLADDQPDQLLQQVRELGHPIELFINNAGFGGLAKFQETDPETVDQMVNLNVRVATRLLYGIVPAMCERRSGTVVNLASTASFQPVVFMPAYAATKSYMLYFSEALWPELKKFNVHVMALCPGFTRTEFLDVANIKGWQTRFAHTSPQVVSAAIRGIRRRKPVVVVGWLNWMLAQFPRFVPRALLARLSMYYMKPPRSRA